MTPERCNRNKVLFNLVCSEDRTTNIPRSVRNDGKLEPSLEIKDVPTQTHTITLFVFGTRKAAAAVR